MNPDGTKAQPDTEVDAEVVTPEDSNFEPFIDLIKRRFLWYLDSYMDTIEKEQEYVAEGETFVKMPFEHTGNIMEGKFLYSVLKQRLCYIRAVLDEEPAQWAEEGKIAASRDLGVAVNLRRQFEQTVEHYKKDSVNLELEDDNPFVWKLVSQQSSRASHSGGNVRAYIHLTETVDIYR